MQRSDIEKRLTARYPPSIYVSVFNGGNYSFFGLLADLSKTGFKLSTQAKISVDQQFELALKNPFSGKSNDYNQFSVQAKWCKKNHDGLYEAGFEFLDFQDASKSLFERLNADFETTAIAMNKLEENS